jgi:hypothetical protein
MDYIVVHQLRKVIAWSNKCGGSSVRRQIILDLNDPILLERLPKEGSWILINELFPRNPRRPTVPMDYSFEWYVRDPFFRVLSCFINRKILIDADDPNITFRDFVFNLPYFRHKSINIRGHTTPQMTNYFVAPWNIIDIKNAKFSFHQKMNHTNYGLGYKENAWNIPSKDLVDNKTTYSPESFYSKEIVDALRILYADDYNFLQDKINLI